MIQSGVVAAAPQISLLHRDRIAPGDFFAEFIRLVTVGAAERAFVLHVLPNVPALLVPGAGLAQAIFIE